MSTRAPLILWFRQDLRLADNRALSAAVASGQPIVAAFILHDAGARHSRPGEAGRWWLHHSLGSFSQSLERLGGSLILRRGQTPNVLRELIRETGASALYFTRCYEPHAVAIEQSIHQNLGRDITVRRFGGNLLFEPEAIRTGADRPYKVFTPFWKACLAAGQPSAAVAAPDRIDFLHQSPGGDALPAWKLLPEQPNWAEQFTPHWQPGEAGAQARLDRFVQHQVADYQTTRDRPDMEATSRLSPHLHFVGWREFAYHVLFHWPDLPDRPLRREFARFPWRPDDELTKAWQRGRTGYPIVDAGMRELWATGWMHNRVRMIAASFLVKDLLIPWQVGEAWFWDTLVDADLANNSAGWQWVAGCGTDAAPFFRIFNPVRQGERFDPSGEYVRKWVPELAGLPDAYIHAPWNAPDEILAAAGIELGSEYPFPVIDHGFARDRALEALASIKK
jgi:deoxyribodipyrimidine photo-lyase